MSDINFVYWISVSRRLSLLTLFFCDFGTHFICNLINSFQVSIPFLGPLKISNALRMHKKDEHRAEMG